jgi:hypothetical protein
MGHKKHNYSMKNFVKDVGKVTKPIHKDASNVLSAMNKDFNHLGYVESVRQSLQGNDTSQPYETTHPPGHCRVPDFA